MEQIADGEPEYREDRVRVTLLLTEEQADLLEDAIAQGALKISGIVRTQRGSPQDKLASPDNQCQVQEQTRGSKPKDEVAPPK